MHPLSYPFVPKGRSVALSCQCAIRRVLLAAASLGREEQPDLYRHVHPHGHAAARLARSFAAAAGCAGGFGGPTLDEIELGAHLHDFGKYLISKSILLKPGPLTEQERSVVSLHPVYGAQVLSGLPAITDTVLGIVLHHHEHWDGSGYPEGLAGTSIPLAARLVAVVDVYTSLRSRRSYKQALTKQAALGALRGMAGRELDPSLAEDFARFACDKGQELLFLSG
jgi:HD-GYP domain-containing protein (c-di-GMP phosphodiesterase class II)